MKEKLKDWILFSLVAVIFVGVLVGFLAGCQEEKSVSELSPPRKVDYEEKEKKPTKEEKEKWYRTEQVLFILISQKLKEMSEYFGTYDGTQSWIDGAKEKVAAVDRAVTALKVHEPIDDETKKLYDALQSPLEDFHWAMVNIPRALDSGDNELLQEAADRMDMGSQKLELIQRDLSLPK